MGKVAAAAMVAAVLGVLLRKHVPELALLLTLCAGLWILSAVLDGLGAVAQLMEELRQLAGISEELIEPVVKTVVISVLTKLTVELCRASGEGGVAAFVETAGTVLALVVTLPLVRAVSVLMMELLSCG